MAGRRYVEPARTYVSSLVLLAIFIAGFLLDLLALGGGRTHLIAWVIAAVLVIGTDVLIIYAARSLRSIVVTDDAVSVGDDRLARADIAGVRVGREEGARILGRRPGEGMPRGTA